MSGERFSVDPAMRVFITDLRLSVRTVLRSAGLPEGLFGRDAVALTPTEYYRLWEALEHEAGERDLAVEVGSAISVETFSPPILAALCSPNLSVAARRIADFKPLIGPLRLEVREGSDGITVAYRWPEHHRPPDLLATSELVFWAALARIGTRRRVRPTRVTVVHLPAALADLEAYFGARVVTGDEYAVTFSAADAGSPFLTENESMWRIFAPELRKRLSDLTADAHIADQVRAALVESLPAGDSSMVSVAQRLAVSQRTLQRKLFQDGTSFKEVLAATREQLATSYLQQDGLRVAEIAYLLGYDDVNSFYRAFRGWTGTTPELQRVRLAKVSG